MSDRRILFIPKEYSAIIAVLLAIVMSVLDGTIMNIALPTLTESFHISASTSIWLINAYQLVIAILLLPMSSLGEIYGYRRIFLMGVSLFTVASFSCALCNDFVTLTIARIIQGMGAACIMSVNPALIRLIYPPEFLGRGMGINAMVIAVSAAAGPSIAGSILSIASWHWLFLINIPIGILAFVLGRKLLPENIEKGTHKFDKIGALQTALTFGLFILALEDIAHRKDISIIIIEFILFLSIGYMLVKRELKQSNPILPVDLLKIPIFSLSISSSVVSFSAQMLAMISLPFFLQNVLHFNPVEIGAMLTPWPIANMISAPLGGKLIDKIHPGILGASGMGIFAFGLFMLYMLPDNPSALNIIWRIAFCGFGFGLFQTPNNVTIVSSTPPSRSGGASGMLGVARLIGQTLGTSLVAFIFSLLPLGKKSAACILLAMTFALVAAVISVVRVTQKSPVKRRVN